MEYRKLEPGDTVYRFKEEADYAYFIFKGQVMVQIPDAYARTKKPEQRLTQKILKLDKTNEEPKKTNFSE